MLRRPDPGGPSPESSRSSSGVLKPPERSGRSVEPSSRARCTLAEAQLSPGASCAPTTRQGEYVPVQTPHVELQLMVAAHIPFARRASHNSAGFASKQPPPLLVAQKDLVVLVSPLRLASHARCMATWRPRGMERSARWTWA